MAPPRPGSPETDTSSKPSSKPDMNSSRPDDVFSPTTAWTSDERPHRVQDMVYSLDHVKQIQDRHLVQTLEEHFSQFNLDWNEEPTTPIAIDLYKFIRTKFSLPLYEDVKIEYLSRGDFNHVFAIQALTSPRDDDEDSHGQLPRTLVLRICLPLDPYYKMESEVATMHLARESGLPVPRVFFFDSTASNPFQLEWMIMEYISPEYNKLMAEDCEDIQEDIPVMEKLSQNIVDLLNKLAKKSQFNQIGGLFIDWTTGKYFVGPCVDYPFTKGPRVYYSDTISRGPFNTIEEYISARLSLQIRDAENDDIRDESFRFFSPCYCRPKQGTQGKILQCEHLSQLRKNYRGLLLSARDNLVPALMKKIRDMNSQQGLDGPVDGHTTCLRHHDLHAHNIFIKKPGKTLKRLPHKWKHNSPVPRSNTPSISAIIDWEGITLLPRCLHRPAPKFAEWLAFPTGKRAIYPTGEKSGPSLEQLLGGYARVSSNHGYPFMPPAECTSPQGTALLTFMLRLRNVQDMYPEDIEWFQEAFEFFGFDAGDYDVVEFESESDTSGTSSELADDDDTALQSPPLFRLGAAEPAGTSHADAADQAARPSQPAPPVNSEEFEDVALGPPPKIDVRLLPVEYNPEEPMQVPLQELFRGYENNNHIYRWNRNGGVPSAPAEATGNEVASQSRQVPFSLPDYILRMFCCR